MNFNSADAMNRHLAINLPSMKGFRIANIYLMGHKLHGESTGVVLTRFIVSCWHAGVAPVLVLEDTCLGGPLVSKFAQMTANYVGKRPDGDFGIYFANVASRETKELLLKSINGAYKVWFVTTK